MEMRVLGTKTANLFWNLLLYYIIFANNRTAHFLHCDVYDYRPDKVAWHGSHVLGDRAMDTYCDAWHSSGSDRFGLGSPLNGDRLLEQVRYSCDNKFALLCIEVASESSRRKKRSGENSDNDNELSEHEYQEHLKDLLGN